MKKNWWIVGILVFVLIGGVSLFIFNQNEKERKEQQIIKMETVTAKQIKNTFVNVTEIRFAEKYYENSLTGYTSVDITITTSYGVISDIDASMSLNNKAKRLESYPVDPKLLEGVTNNIIKVIFSNKTEENL